MLPGANLVEVKDSLYVYQILHNIQIGKEVCGRSAKDDKGQCTKGRSGKNEENSRSCRRYSRSILKRVALLLESKEW